ncbi:hypothetical protein HPP92_010162 [Vanilla planifolia]|uniref:TatD related DNase n=1 Tax=Vanilla planifolia TaxID=51239 RepID=A0A835UXA0_VANPL|nr:hypothetical protein HPP92_010162 [Vanilla planifolia]
MPIATSRIRESPFLAPHVIHTAVEAGVVRFAVNGVSEKDWHIVKQMGEQYSSVIPCFGLHPWYVTERSPLWLQSMKVFFATAPFAAVGEVGRFSFLIYLTGGDKKIDNLVLDGGELDVEEENL